MSDLQIISLIMQENMLFSGEIYIAGKNFTLPPAVTAVTNITSVPDKFGQYRSMILFILRFLYGSSEQQYSAAM